MKKHLYTILFALLLLFLFLPMVQEHTKLFKIKPLNGVFVPTKFPKLTLESVQNGEYQSQLEKYVSENFGFRECVIRLYNQYVWSVFKKTYNKGLEHGKGNWFYYGAAYRDYYGLEQAKWYDDREDAIASIERNVDRMCILRDILKQFNIEFMTFMAPSKAFVYPEYLPERERDTTAIRAFEYFDKRFQEIGFPNIEMTSWFYSIRDTLEYPLFPTIDTHWGFSSVYAFDSLFRFMNSLNDFGMPTIRYGEPVKDRKLWTYDEGLLNLMCHVKNKNYNYNIDVFVENKNGNKPRVLFVGDSFIWAMLNRIPCKDIFENIEIWYYNSSIHEGFKRKDAIAKKKDINPLASILNADYVIFYSSSHQWHRATYKFVDQTLAELGVNDSTSFVMEGNKNVERALTQIEIEKDKDWHNALNVYALTNNTSYKKVINKEIDNVLNNKPLLKDQVGDDSILFEKEVQDLINKWKSDSQAVKNIKEKAKKRGITFDEMIRKDAVWVIQQRKAKE